MLTSTSHVLFLVLAPVASVVTVAMNAVTIYVFGWKLKISSLTVLLIVNICICDILVGLYSNTFYMISLAHPTFAWSTGALGCKTFKSLTMLINVVQIFSLCIINVDRIRRLLYATHMQWNLNHGKAFLLLTWLLSLLIAAPRVVLFDEYEVQTPVNASNASRIVNRLCKPTGMNTQGRTITIVGTFVIAYVIPVCLMTYTLLRAEIFMWKRRRQISQAGTSIGQNTVKMNYKMSLTFNLLGALFMAVWTPFFIMSVLDFSLRLQSIKELHHVNFGYRCTLLLLGSAKPVVYFLVLKKFRQSLDWCSCFKRMCCKSRVSSSYPTSTATGNNTGTVQSTEC